MNHQEWSNGLAQQQNMNSNVFASLLYGNAGSSQNSQQQLPYTPPPPIAGSTKEKSMFKEITSDVRGFILEHRSIIYFLVFALLIDHLIFRGVFKARLESMVDKMVAKVEDKIK